MKKLLLFCFIACSQHIQAMTMKDAPKRQKQEITCPSLIKSCCAAAMACCLIANPVQANIPQSDPYLPVSCNNMRSQFMTDQEQLDSVCLWNHQTHEYDDVRLGFTFAKTQNPQPRQCRQRKHAKTEASENEIRYLKPPKLNNGNILEEVVCTRPRRVDDEGGQAPRVEREIVGGQTVIHNYGHSSGGLTMAWGAAQEAADLLQPEDSKDITIVGGGISGLSTAYSLIEDGITPTAIIAREFEDLTSHKAGGLFAHQSSNPNNATRNKVNGWIAASLPKYRAIANGDVPELAGCARQVPAYFVDRKSSDLESSVEAGVLQPAKDVIVDFQNGMRRNMVVYDDNIFINTYCIMAKLRAYLESNGVVFIQKDVSDLSTLPHRTIFNCAGLGGSVLAKENSAAMIPVQGHLLLLKGQKAQELEYTIEVELGNGETEEDKHVTYLMYYLPKRKPDAEDDEIGVLGGTSIKLKGNEVMNHTAYFARVLQGVREYFGETKK